MTTNTSFAGRGFLLVLGLLLVSALGCTAMGLRDKAQEAKHMEERQAAIARRTAQLSQRSGDPAAMRALAYLLLATTDARAAEEAGAPALLERAAAQGDLQAQAILGVVLATGKYPVGNYSGGTSPLFDRPRGIEMLKHVASQTCKISLMGDPEANTYSHPSRGDMNVVEELRSLLLDERREDEAQLWQARDIVHCANRDWTPLPDGPDLQSMTLRERRELLVLHLLLPDNERLGQASAGMSGDDIAAAKREADGLREQVAASERAYPRPTHKVFP